MTPPSSAPRENPPVSLLERFDTVATEEARDMIQKMTAKELETLIFEIESTIDVPNVFKEATVRETLDRRIEEEGHILDETRSRWQELKERVSRPKETRRPIMKKDDEDKINENRYFFDDALDRILPDDWSQNQKRAVAGLTLGAAALIGWLMMRGDKAKDAADKSGGGFFKKLIIGALAFVGIGGMVYTYIQSKGWIRDIGKGVKDKAEDAVKNVGEKAKKAGERAGESIESQESENIRQIWLLNGLIWINPKRADDADISGDKAAQGAVLSLIGDKDVKDMTIGQLKNINNANDASALLKHTSIAPSNDKNKALHFIALICRDHEENVKQRMVQDGVDMDIDDIPVGAFFRYIGQVSRGLGRLKSKLETTKFYHLTPDIIRETLCDPKEIIKDISEDISFISALEKDVPALDGKGMEFVIFCGLNQTRFVSDISVPKMTNAEHDQEEIDEIRVFIDAIQAMQSAVQHAKPFLLQFGQRNDAYKEKIDAYLKENLTILDVLQIYSYLHAMREDDGSLPETIKDASALPALMMQLKAISMVGAKDDNRGLLGKQMTTDIIVNSSKMDIDLPDQAKDILKNTGISVAKFGMEWVADKTIEISQWGYASYGSALNAYPKSTLSGTVLAGAAAAQLYREQCASLTNAKLNLVKGSGKMSDFAMRLLYGVNDPTVRSQMRQRIFDGEKIADSKSNIVVKPGKANINDAGLLGRRISRPSQLKEMNKDLHKMAQKDTSVAMRTLNKKLSIEMSDLHLNRAGLERNIEAGMRKYPSLDRKTFLMKTVEGKSITAEVSKINAQIIDRAKNYKPSVVKIVSQGATENFDELTSVQKASVRKLLIEGGEKVTIHGMTRGMVRAIGKRIFIMAPLITLVAATSATKSGSEKWTDEAGSIGLSLIPVYGTYMDFKAAVTGRDSYNTEKKVNRLASLGFGILGAGSDVLLLAGGTGYLLRGATWLFKGGIKGASTAIRVAGKMDDITKFAASSKKLKIAMAAGGASGVGGIVYDTFYQEVDSIPME